MWGVQVKNGGTYGIPYRALRVAGIVGGPLRSPMTADRQAGHLRSATIVLGFHPDVNAGATAQR